MSNGSFAVIAALELGNKEEHGDAAFDLRVTLKSGTVIEGPHVGLVQGARSLHMQERVDVEGEEALIDTFVPTDSIEFVQVIW
jgi:hypothetical protein